MASQTKNPAIIVLGFERPDSLKRLLFSIYKAKYNSKIEIPLVISIDRGENKEIERIAKEFNWHFGKKEVVLHEKRLGMRNHSLYCGNLSKKFGSIIFLEDDSYVSPEYYNYACQALAKYRKSENISGIALYSFSFNEFTHLNFRALDDGFDNYFVQSATTWGVAWTEKQWIDFEKWFNKNHTIPVTLNDNLPRKVFSWPETSWKKYINKYLVTENKYFVYPKISLITNYVEIGSHEGQTTNNFQVPILIGQKAYKFSSLSESLSVYDAFYELNSNVLKKINPSLDGYNFEIDLFGLKDLSKVDSEYVITSRSCNSHIRSFGCKLYPVELNLALNVPGKFFYLAKTTECLNKKNKNEILFNMHIQKELDFTVYTAFVWNKLTESIKLKIKKILKMMNLRFWN
jgi:hypothetical protein